MTEELKSKLNILKDFNVVVYGTGVIAERFLDEAADYSIMGVLDNIRKNGSFKGYRILDWCDINDNNSIVLVICALESNYKVIYERIKENYRGKFLDVIGVNGRSIKEYHWADYDLERVVAISKVSKEKLYYEIDRHKYISFDIFDTLVMRKVLDPSDIFDIVQDSLLALKIDFPSFKEQRIAIGRESKYQNIDNIYECLNNENISDEKIEQIKRLEIETEKRMIVPRKDIVEAFRYALSKDKVVTLISDMYLSAKIIRDILADNGIEGYNNILVSCDIGKRKDEEGGLFNYYLSIYGIDDPKQCLHIGDNEESDIKQALFEGMDVYQIYKALDMAKISYIRNILKFKNFNEKLIAGYVISKVFNSPFEINKNNGKVIVDSWSMFGEIFIYPIMYDYIQGILSFCTTEKPSCILFAARDGYLPYLVYERVKKRLFWRDMPDARYLLISRTAAISLCSNIEKLKFISRVYKNKIHELSLDDVLNEFGRISNKERYMSYLKRLGVDQNGKNIFCEFYSKGTTQLLIEDMFDNIAGYYYMHQVIEGEYPTRIDSTYLINSESVNREYKFFQRYEEPIERVLSSNTGKFLYIDNEEKPVFGKDLRTGEEKDAIREIQQAVCNAIDESYFTNKMEDGSLREVISFLLQCINDGNIVCQGISKELFDL